MATKAEWFRYHAERSGPKKEKAAERRRMPRELETGSTAARNESERAGRKAVFALEDAPPGTRPSRKSTRAASNRQKTDAAARLRRAVSEARPASRGGRVPRGRATVR